MVVLVKASGSMTEQYHKLTTEQHIKNREKWLVSSSRWINKKTRGKRSGRRLKLTSSDSFSDRNSASLRGGLSTARSVTRGVESFCRVKEAARCCFANRGAAASFSPEGFRGKLRLVSFVFKMWRRLQFRRHPQDGVKAKPPLKHTHTHRHTACGLFKSNPIEASVMRSRTLNWRFGPIPHAQSVVASIGGLGCKRHTWQNMTKRNQCSNPFCCFCSYGGMFVLFS